MFAGVASEDNEASHDVLLPSNYQAYKIEHPFSWTLCSKYGSRSLNLQSLMALTRAINALLLAACAQPSIPGLIFGINGSITHIGYCLLPLSHCRAEKGQSCEYSGYTHTS